MIEITLYLMVAILFGFLFGWLITRALLKEKYERHIAQYKELLFSTKNVNIVEEELAQCKTANSKLTSENNKVLLDNNEKKLQIHTISKKLAEVKDLKKRITEKNSIIEQLTFKLSTRENQLIQLMNKIEKKEPKDS